MRKICDEWVTQKHDLETLRTYLDKKDRAVDKKDRAETPPDETMPIKSCLRNIRFGTPEDQAIGCKICKNKFPDYYSECQKMKGKQE